MKNPTHEQTKHFYKPIKFTLEDHETIAKLANDLRKERGTKVYLPGTVIEAVTFMLKYRNDPRLLNNPSEDKKDAKTI